MSEHPPPPRPPHRRARIGEILVSQGLLGQADLEVALAAQRSDPRRLGEILVARRLVTEEELYRALAEQYGVPFEHQLATPPREVATVIPHHIAERHHMVALGEEGGRLRVATSDPGNVLAIDDVVLMTGREVEVMVATPGSIQRVIEEAYPNLDEFPALMGDMVAPGLRIPGEVPAYTHDLEALRELLLTALDRAWERGAHELVLEPGHAGTRVLLRLGEYLCPSVDIPAPSRETFLQAAGELLQMDLTSGGPPASLVLPIRRNDAPREVPVCTLPGPHGPRVHLLLRSDEPAQEERRAALLSGRTGLELFVGPGAPERARRLAYELESLAPRSYSICGVASTPALDLAPAFLARAPAQGDDPATAGLVAAAVAQDPDVLVLDLPTCPAAARVAWEEATAGRLVLATVSGASPREALELFRCAGVRTGPLARVLRVIHFGRLVGRLCPRCRVPDAAGPALLAGMEATLGPAPPAWPGPAPARPYRRGPGCRSCRGTGHQGSVALQWTIEVDPALRADLEAERWGALRGPGAAGYLGDLRRLALAGELALGEALGA